jgi:hypothetical protein
MTENVGRSGARTPGHVAPWKLRQPRRLPPTHVAPSNARKPTRRTRARFARNPPTCNILCSHDPATNRIGANGPPHLEPIHGVGTQAAATTRPSGGRIAAQAATATARRDGGVDGRFHEDSALSPRSSTARETTASSRIRPQAPTREAARSECKAARRPLHRLVAVSVRLLEQWPIDLEHPGRPQKRRWWIGIETLGSGFHRGRAGRF